MVDHSVLIVCVYRDGKRLDFKRCFTEGSAIEQALIFSKMYKNYDSITIDRKKWDD